MRSNPRHRLKLAVLSESENRLEWDGKSDAIEWLRCDAAGNACFEFSSANGVISPFDPSKGPADLSDFAGIVIVGSASFFESIREIWRSSFPGAGLSFAHAPSWDTESILRAGLECMANSLIEETVHAGNVSLQLAEYRHEFDRLQRSFSGLEQQFGLQTLQRKTQIFEYLADFDPPARKERRKEFKSFAIPSGGSVTQYVPVNSLGFSGFSLCIGSVPENPEAPLVVRLRAIETGTVLGVWLISSETARAGWVQVALHRAIDEQALSLEVSVECSSNSIGWGIVLGPPHPYMGFCAYTESGARLSAPIAIRAFASLPGVSVPATTDVVRPVDGPDIHFIYLPEETYNSVTQVFPLSQKDKPALVFYDAVLGCLTVHPHVGGVTVGRIQAVVPKRSWGLSVQIQLAHQNACPTDFGLFVCRQQDEKRMLAGLSELESPTASFSGWRNLSPQETGVLTLTLPSAFANGIPIYLLTRQAPESSPDFGWARFGRIGFNILPASLADDQTPCAPGAAVTANVPARDEVEISPTIA